MFFFFNVRVKVFDGEKLNGMLISYSPDELITVLDKDNNTKNMILLCNYLTA